jgi:hypothetical protein
VKEIIYTTGEYHFYPIDLYHLDKYYLKKENFLYQLVTMEMEVEEDRGVLTTECVNGDDLHVYKCRFASDALLCVSKSVIKHRLSLSRWIWILHPPQLTKLRDLKEGHYKGLGEQNNIKALVKIQYNTIQLSDSFYHTNQTDILAYIHGIIPDGLIKDLTGQVVNLPIYSILFRIII